MKDGGGLAEQRTDEISAVRQQWYEARAGLAVLAPPSVLPAADEWSGAVDEDSPLKKGDAQVCPTGTRGSCARRFLVHAKCDLPSDLSAPPPRRDRDSTDQVGSLGEPGLARFGKTYAGDPDVVAEHLAKDAAVREADTLLVTIPSALGVDDNVHLMQSIVDHVAPALGWTRAD